MARQKSEIRAALWDEPMNAVTIGKLHIRYLLPASARSQKDRLDRVIREAVDGYLDLALARTDVSMDEEICIRSIRTAARVRLSGPDTMVAAAWSLAIADAVHQTISNPSLDVVLYRSRSHALLDLVAGATAGELGRSWAWRQMGLWRAADTIDQIMATQEAMRALCSEPRVAVQILATLARSNHHARTLARLIIRASSDEWLALARAVLEVATSSVSAILHQDDVVSASGGHMPAALFIFEHSAIARHAVPLLASERIARPVTIALAVLAVAEIEPSALCGTAQAVRVLVGAVSGVLRSATHRSEPGRVAVPKLVKQEAMHLPDSSTPEEYPTPDPRAYANTCGGGLLFFVDLADRLGLPNQLRDSFPGCSLRFVLHQLAIMLTAVDPNDAAALAFAGLPPNSLPPSHGAEPLVGDGLAVIATARARLIMAVRERLAQRPHLEQLLALDDDALSAFVCRRNARVLADPGWVEIRFSLNDVSTEIRGAGLDLDPGWVPWLGVVMRFVYA